MTAEMNTGSTLFVHIYQTPRYMHQAQSIYAAVFTWRLSITTFMHFLLN
jgi:hypothetical protein